MLGDRYGLDDVRAALLAREQWQPYPTVADRAGWTALPAAVQSELVARGVAKLGYAWPRLPATLFLEYTREGNRSNFEWQQTYRRRALRDLILAECVEGEGRFLDDIVDGIWVMCEETYWGYPAHVSVQAAGVGLPDVEEPTVDLFAAEAVALLAWADYLLGSRLDAVSPLVRRRIACEARRRVLDPCLARDDFWWMGFDPGDHGVNNWNPWVNSNWLTAALLLDDDRDRRATTVHKVLRSLDVFLDIYADGGGCDEGPGYWGRAAASLFDCLDLLCSATSGAIDVFGEPKIANMARYIYRVQIDGAYYVNFADASAINEPNAALVLRYGQAIGDASMVAFGAWLLQSGPEHSATRGDSIGRMLPALFDLPDLTDVAPLQPRPRDVWFEGVEVMVARDQAATADGLFVAAKAGHNGESHNHNDVGNVIVYVDGCPLVVDAGVETYRKQTFSPQRYEIWTMQSAYHTLLPVINGVMQAPGADYAARDVAYHFDGERAELSMDLAAAYPPEAGVASWQRRVTLVRGDAVTITDRYALRGMPAEVRMSIVTPSDIEVVPGAVVFRGRPFGPPDAGRRSASGRLDLPAAVDAVAVERIAISDDRLGGVWGQGLNRLLLTFNEPASEGTWIWRITPER